MLSRSPWGLYAGVYLWYFKQCWFSSQILGLENNLSQKTLNDVNFGTEKKSFSLGRKTSALWHFFWGHRAQWTGSYAKVILVAGESLQHVFCCGVFESLFFQIFYDQSRSNSFECPVHDCGSRVIVLCHYTCHTKPHEMPLIHIYLI